MDRLSNLGGAEKKSKSLKYKNESVNNRISKDSAKETIPQVSQIDFEKEISALDDVPKYKGDFQSMLIGGLPTQAPNINFIQLQEQLYNLDQTLSLLMEERKKEAAEFKKRIDIQDQEAKIMANRERQLLATKIKMEMDMEKDALRRLKELKVNIKKVEAQTKIFEKTIEALIAKRRAEDTKNRKMLDALATKENQARLKREQAEANLTSLDLIQKQKILQKALKQKQLLRLEAGDEDPDVPEVEEKEEEEEVVVEEEIVEIPPPPLPDLPNKTCEDPCGYPYEMFEKNVEELRPCRMNRVNEFQRGLCSPPRTVDEQNCYRYPNNVCQTPQTRQPHHPIDAPGMPYIASFDLIKILSRGRFTEVALVRSSMTNNKYIVKSICKNNNISRICRLKTVFTILRENRHPFIVNMHDFTQDDNRVHFVMEYLCNGNLKEHLKRFVVFEEGEVVFFSACALQAIDHLHSLDIAHRDVKLDNLVLDGCGYAKLVDFDLAIPYVAYDTPLYDKAGTSIYKSPEFFKPCEFTTRAADFWALGVVIHALLTAKCINTKPCLRLADEKLSPVAEDLLVQMLNLVPSQRLGRGLNGGHAIMGHPFFKEINWTALYQKRLHPPKRFVTRSWDHADAGRLY